MVGEFLGQDYLNAAASFGSNLGSGVLSTLGGAASTATNAFGSALGTAYDYGAGTSNYLTNMVQQSQQPQGNTIRNTQFSVPELGSFGQSFNMNALTSGFSSMKSPDIFGSLGGAGNTLSNFGGGLFNTGNSFLNSLTSPSRSQTSQIQPQQFTPSPSPSTQSMQKEYDTMIGSAASSSPLDLLKPISTIGGSLLNTASTRLQNYGSDLLSPAMLTGTLVTSAQPSKQYQAPSFEPSKAQNVADITQAPKNSSALGSSFDSAAKFVNDAFGFGKTKEKSSSIDDRTTVYKSPTGSNNLIVSNTGKANQAVNIDEGRKDLQNIAEPVSQAPIINGERVNQPKDSNGNIIIGYSLSRPDEEYLKNDPYLKSRWFTNIGDQPARNLINKEVTDTWSAGVDKDGKPIETKYTISSLPEALEFRRQQALHDAFSADEKKELQNSGISSVKMADFYANELGKYAQNKVTLSSGFHHMTKDSGKSFAYNPYENAGDVALAFLKGGGRDNFAKNYGWNSDVVGKFALTSLLPGGLGLDETRWKAALSPDNMKQVLSADFRPAIMKLLGSEGSAGPYAALKGISAEADIAKLPKEWQTALANIAAGTPQKETVLQSNGQELQKEDILQPDGQILKKGFMRDVFKTVDVTRPTSYTIPDYYKLVPESKEGIVDFNSDLVGSKVTAGSSTEAKLDKIPEVKIYIPEGRGRNGEREYKEIIGKVLINADTGEQTYYQRHIDPSRVGENGSLGLSYQIIGGAGQNSAQSGEFQFGTPLGPTVRNQEGKLIDTSGILNLVQNKFTPSQQATINKDLETIFSATDNFEGDRRASSAMKELITMGLSNEQINAMTNARFTGQVPTAGYSALNLANFVSTTGAKPTVSAPWVFPGGTTSPVLITGNANQALQGGKISYIEDNKPGYAIRNLIAFTNDIKNDYNNLGDLSVPGTNLNYNPQGVSQQVGRFANIFTVPKVDIPLATGPSPLLNKDLGGGSKIIGGEIVRPPGYTGTNATIQTMPEMIITPGTQPGTSKMQQEKITTALEQLKQTPTNSPEFTIYKKQLIDMGLKDDQIRTSVNAIKDNRMTTDEASKGLVYSVTTLPPAPTTITQVQSKPGGTFAIANNLMDMIIPRAQAADNNMEFKYGSGLPVTPESLGVTQQKSFDIGESLRSLFVSTPLGATLIGTPEERAKGEQTRQKIDQYTNVLGVGMIGGPSTASRATQVISGAELFSPKAAPVLDRIILTAKGAAPSLSEVRVPGISNLVYTSQRPLGAIPLSKGANIYDVGTGVLAAKAVTSDKTPDKLNDILTSIGKFGIGLLPKQEKSYTEPKYESQANREFSGEMKSTVEQKPLTMLDITGGIVKASPLGLVTGLFSPTYSAVQTVTGETKSKEQAISNYDTSKKELMDNLISAQKSGVVIIDKNGQVYSGLSNDDKTFSTLLDRGVSDMKYDRADPMQISALTKYMDSEKALGENANKIKDLQKKEESTSDFMRSITGETAQDYIATKYTKPYMPSYETFGTNFLNMSADPFVKNLSGVEKTIGIKPLYEETDVTNLLPSEHFLAYNRPEGFTKTVYESDQPGAKGIKATYGGKTGGLYDTAQFAQATTQGVFNYPREKPLETVSFLTLPTGFGIAEDILTGTALKIAPKSGTLIKTGTQMTKGGLLGLMGGSDVAHVTGRDLISDRGILAPSIVGKDDQGNLLYAGQSAREWGGRAGEKLPNWLIMMGPGAKVQQTLYQPKYTPELGNYETVFDRFGAAATRKMIPAEEKIAQTIDIIPDMFKALKKSGISESIKVGKEGTSGQNIEAIKTTTEMNILPQKVLGLPEGTKIAQPNLGYLSGVKGLSERAYTYAANKLHGTGDELTIKGSTAGMTTIGNIKDGKMIGYGDQSIKINDVGSVSKGKVIVRPAKDIDVSTQSPSTFVKAYMEGTQRALESDGWSNVKISQKGNLYSADRYYEISGKTPEGVSQKFYTQDGADLKFIGSDVVRPTGGKSFNVERMLYETEPEVPFRLSTLLFGETGTRGKSKSESLSTTNEKLVNPYINKGVEKSDISKMYVDDVSVTSLDKINFINRFMKTARKGGPEVEKIPKTTWDIVNTQNEMAMRFEINKASGKFSDAEIALGQKALTTNKAAIDKLLDGTYDVRYTPNGPLQKLKLRDAVENYNAKVQGGIDYYRYPQAINTNVKGIDVYHRGSITDTSAAAMTNAGLAELKTKDIETLKLPGGKTSFITPYGLAEVSKKDISKVEKATTVKGAGRSASASSVVGMVAPISLIEKDRESPLSGRSLSSLITPLSSEVSSNALITKPPSSEPSSKGSSSSSESSSSSSGSSYFSSYSPSSSSSSSQSPSSSSSSQSSSSMAPFARGGGFMGGFPFLAPPGGGGGSSGGGGRMNAIIRNPLAALSVAGTGNQFMKFGTVNDFVRSVKGNLGNANQNIVGTMQTPAGSGNTAVVSRGALESLQEASAISPIRGITARKSKKQKVKAKRQISMPEITTPHINLKLQTKGNLSVKSKKKLKKGRK